MVNNKRRLLFNIKNIPKNAPKLKTVIFPDLDQKVFPELNLESLPYAVRRNILYVVDKSTKTPKYFDINDNICVKRLTVHFKNGLKISIIRGDGTYSGFNTFEVGIIDDDGFTPKYFKDKHLGDDIAGWVTLDSVLYYINKLARIK